MHRTVSTAASLLIVLGFAAVAAPASADHTDPREPLAPTEGQIEEGIERGDGTWEHLANFPGVANPALTGGGTDLEFFQPPGSKDIWGSFGTLGQDEAGSIGQRLIRLTKNGRVEPTWQADHGSAHCPPASTSVTGLQHDTQVAQLSGVTLMTDTTDATGRCHDPAGGGIEIVDTTNVARPGEVHLLRFPGFTHTNTVDQQAPLDRLQQLLRLRRPQLDRRREHAVVLRRQAHDDQTTARPVPSGGLPDPAAGRVDPAARPDDR